MAATWRLKGRRGEPKVAQKSALEGLGDRLVGVLGASGGTRRVLRLANGRKSAQLAQGRTSKLSIGQDMGLDLVYLSTIYFWPQPVKAIGSGWESRKL